MQNDLFDLDELQVYLGYDYKINDYITIHQPTVGAIAEFGEREYYSMITTLTSTPSDMMSELDSIGINFMEVDDFDLFMMLSSGLTVDKTNILFGDLDFTKFKPYLNENTNEKILYNLDNDAIIDRLAYLKIANYLRVVHGLKANRDKAANETTRKIMIQLDKNKKAKAKKDGYHSQLKQLISAMMRYPGFKYKKNELIECGIYEFMDTVKGAQIYVSSTALLQGSYSGMIDTSKIKSKNFNWLRDPNDD